MIKFLSKLKFLFKKKIETVICKNIIQKNKCLKIKNDFCYTQWQDCIKHNKQLKINYREVSEKLKELIRLNNELVKKSQESKIILNITKYISMQAVERLLKKEFPDANIYLSDNRYGIISKEQCINILLKDKTNTKKYISESHDCDDFSFILQGTLSKYDIPFGIIWIEKPYAHALNIVIVSEKEELKVYCVEPQTDKMFKKPVNYKGILIVV